MSDMQIYTANMYLEHDPFNINTGATDTLGPVEGTSASSVQGESSTRAASTRFFEVTGPKLLENIKSGEVIHVARSGHQITALGAHNILLELIDALGTRDK